MPISVYTGKGAMRRLRKKYAKKPIPKTSVKTIQSIAKRTIMRNAEHKYNDQDTTAQNLGVQLSVPNTGLLINLELLSGPNGITQGDLNFRQRNANRINLTSLYFQIDTFIPTSGDNTNIVRMVLLQWLKDAPTLTAIQQVLYSGSTGGFNIYSPYNIDYVGSYKILCDKFLPMSFNGSNRIKSVKKYITKSLYKNIVYTSAGTPTINKGEFFLILVSDSQLAPHPAFEGNFRLRYTDM